MTELPWTSFLPHTQSCWQQAEIFICIMPKQNGKLVEEHSCSSLFTPEGGAISHAWQALCVRRTCCHGCRSYCSSGLQWELRVYLCVCVKTGCTCTSPSLSWIYFSSWWQKLSHALLEIPVVPLSIYDFKMTGFLSVFSLLPIQNQTKRENGQEEDLEARDSEELERKEDNNDKETIHDIRGSTDSER